MNTLAKLHVLVLEENRSTRTALVAILESFGFEKIKQVSDGRAGLDALKGNYLGYDLVICNLDMSGMDGLEFIRHASMYGVGGLILMSSLDESIVSSAEWMARAYSAPLLGALQTPVTKSALAVLLDKLDGNVTVYSDVVGDAGPEDADRRAIEEIEAALANRHFVPYYQPKVSLATGAVVGAEILARWEHPELGVLAPTRFVNLMEAGGLIDPLTTLVLERACGDLKAWSGTGITVPLALNVSPSTLERDGSARRLLDTMVACEVAPSAFTIEITEKAFARDEKSLIENVLRLRMRGCGVSVDDFGTGYSSFHQLQRTPITEIKLDRAFVRRIGNHAKAQSIIESMIELARKLDLSVVAEGIDMQRQHDRLLELGCDAGQGYLYARPMAGAALREWVLARQTDAVVEAA